MGGCGKGAVGRGQGEATVDGEKKKRKVYAVRRHNGSLCTESSLGTVDGEGKGQRSRVGGQELGGGGRKGEGVPEVEHA